MSPVSNDYHAYDDPPLIILGSERTEHDGKSLGITAYCWTLLIAALLSAIAAALIGLHTPPQQADAQELNSTDRTMPEHSEQVADLDH